MPLPPEIFVLPATDGQTLQQKIQQVVSEAIVSGRCAAGERMPSSRGLAAHLGVARITVTLAYAELVANDYLSARGRSGYFVSENAPVRPAFKALPAPVTLQADWTGRLTRSLSLREDIPRPPNWRDYRYPFIYGQSDSDLFDHANWRSCALRAVGRRDFDSLSTDHYHRDDPMLVEFMLRHILPRRGITARPEEILITMGSQNALWIAAELLLDENASAVVENPCYPGLRRILEYRGCVVNAVGVDARGLRLEDIGVEARVVFATPGHHCPSNATMPPDRRKALIERAIRDDFIIVEDDYELELPSVATPPSPALKALDRTGHVIHVGSFSKSVFPGLRLGYMVAPDAFIREARALRGLVLRHPPSHIQRTLAYFLSLGHFDAQMARLARIFSRRRAVMRDSLAHFGLLSPSADRAGGSSFWLRAPDGVDSSVLARDLRGDSVVIEPGRPFFAPDTPDTSFYRMAYSSIPASRVEEGVALVAARARVLKAGS